MLKNGVKNRTFFIRRRKITMKKKLIAMLLAVTLGASMLTACGGGDAKAEKKEEPAKESVQAADEAKDAEVEEETEEVAEETVEEAAEDEVSFEDLQELYASLADNYNAITELYLNENIQQDDDVEEVLNKAKEIIEMMGEATEDDFPDNASRVKMVDAMVAVNEKLGELLPE